MAVALAAVTAPAVCSAAGEIVSTPARVAKLQADLGWQPAPPAVTSPVPARSLSGPSLEEIVADVSRAARAGGADRGGSARPRKPASAPAVRVHLSGRRRWIIFRYFELLRARGTPP